MTPAQAKQSPSVGWYLNTWLHYLRWVHGLSWLYIGLYGTFTIFMILAFLLEGVPENLGLVRGPLTSMLCAILGSLLAIGIAKREMHREAG